MAVKPTTRMHQSNLELCQTLLNQTRSIDHTAELMGEGKNSNINEWREKIIAAVERGELII
jgi:hypothetical protein